MNHHTTIDHAKDSNTPPVIAPSARITAFHAGGDVSTAAPAPKIDDGGPVHPYSWASSAQDNTGRVGLFKYEGNPGMSIRDHFAGQALQGMLSALGRNDMWQGINQTASTNGVDVAKHLATLAYEHADAMLAARKQSGATTSKPTQPLSPLAAVAPR